MIALLIALYPAHWRRRYGEEFRAVLEMRPLGPFDVADVLIGALDARLNSHRLATTSASSGGHRVLLRIGGFGAIVGGVMWVIGLWTASGAGESGGRVLPMIVFMVGSGGILLALVGLSAFQGHHDPYLAWPAFAVPGFGAVASLVGIGAMVVHPEDVPILGDLSPWSIWMIGLMATIVGSTLFAIATIRAAVLSRRAAIALAVTSTVVLIVGFGLASGAVQPIVGLLIPISFVAFGASWVALGVSALRPGPIRAIDPTDLAGAT